MEKGEKKGGWREGGWREMETCSYRKKTHLAVGLMNNNKWAVNGREEHQEHQNAKHKEGRRITDFLEISAWKQSSYLCVMFLSGSSWC